jgi:pantoate--beta-alanine ligase
MLIAHSPNKLINELDTLRFRGGSRRCVSLVTTRGNLHEGHRSVINAARTVSDIVVVAITPPPATQRIRSNVVSAPEFHDIGFVEQSDVDVAYLPSEEDLFPDREALIAFNFANDCELFDDPDYFLNVQLKLINCVQPDIMVWGEKNYIEYFWVRQLVNDLHIRTQMQCIPTVRHANGLALSSDHQLLSVEEKDQAPILFETLNNIAHAIRDGAKSYAKLEKTARVALRGAGFNITSCKILDDTTLQPAHEETTAFRIIGNVTLNGVPVTDNIGLTL